MLGRLQMDVDDCIQEYSELTKAIFSEKLHSMSVNLFTKVQPRFDSEKLRAAIQKVVAKNGQSSETPFNDHDSDRCKVFVCAAAKDLYGIKRLRSYDIPGEDHLPLTITEAALATSAATGYFDPVTFDDRTWIDGALGANNPVRLVEREASDFWCPETGELQPLVKCFVSIGTGDPGKKPVGDDLKKVFDTLKYIATETETTAAEFLSSWRAHYDQRRYFRFNVPQGLQGVGLAEWDRKGVIKEATESYLDDQAQKFSLRDCAKNLATKQYSAVFASEYGSICNPPDVHTAKEWLANRARRHKWLLIVDNIVGESAQEIDYYLPSISEREKYDNGVGHILFTTVSEEWALKWLTIKENTLPLGHLSSLETEELFRSISGAEGDAWTKVLEVLPGYPNTLCLIGSAVAIDRMSPDQVEQALKVPSTKISYLKRDSQDIAFFDTVLANIDNNEEARSRHLNFLTILSYLHTTALDLRLLINCNPHDIRGSEMAVSLNPFQVQNIVMSTFIVRNVIRRARRQLQDILPEPCSAVRLANEVARYSNKSLMQLQREDENQMIITIPDIFQDLLRSKTFSQNSGKEKEYFIISIILAREIGQQLDWRQLGLGDNFASMVSSLMRFAHLATRTWEHSWIAELNCRAAQHVHNRMRTQQACKHYEWAEKHWFQARQPRPSLELWWVIDYGWALIREEDYDRAEIQFRKAYRGHRFIEDKYSHNAIQAKLGLICVARRRGHKKQAEEAHREMLQAYEAPYRANKITTLDWYNISGHLSANLFSQGRYREANEICLGSLTKMTDEYDSADISVGMQNKPEAVEEFIEVIKLMEEHLGADHPLLFATYGDFAFILKRQGDFRGASEWYDKAANGCNRVLGPTHPDTLHHVNELNALLTREEGNM
ncbi:hypothetical protein Hte_011841 [Hypoxylon texense]